MALDQSLVFLAKVEFQAGPDSAIILLASSSFDKGSHGRAALQAEIIFRSESRRVLAAGIAVADK